MAQNYVWPSVTVTATNPSIGLNGALAPISSTEVGGINPSGNLSPLRLDASNNLLVSVSSSALPQGAATAANQVLEIAELTGIHSDTTSIDGKSTTIVSNTGTTATNTGTTATNTGTTATNTGTTATNTGTTATNTGNTAASVSSIDTKSTSIVTNTGATATSVSSIDTKSTSIVTNTGATAASVSSIDTKSTSIVTNTGATATSVSSIDTKTPALGQALNAASVPVVLTASQLSALTPLSTVTVVQPTGTNLHTVVDSSALPLNAATDTLQTSGNASLSSIASNTSGLATSANQVISLGRLSGSLVPTAYDEVVLNYVGATSNFTTVIFKLATVTVKTLTFTYDGSDRLTDVVAS